MTRKPRRLVVALVLALAVSGCGVLGDPADGPAAVPVDGTSSGATTSPDPRSLETRSPEAPPSESPARQPEATQPPGPEVTPAPASPALSSPAPAPPTSEPPPAAPPADGTLRPGDEGPAVLALQERLTELGYWLGTPDGELGHLTTQAVYAIQGAAGLGRDGRVGPQTRQALEAGVRPTARSTSGQVTEIDLDRGLILFVDSGQVSRVLHTSTGTFREYTVEGRTNLADTPGGDWTVDWAHDGWRTADLGRLYRPRYFHSTGVAVHGFGSVPAQPASHGCARVSLAAMDMIWRQDLMPLNSDVTVY